MYSEECTRVCIVFARWSGGHIAWTATIPNKSITPNMSVFLDRLKNARLPDDLGAFSVFNTCIEFINRWSDTGVDFNGKMSSVPIPWVSPSIDKTTITMFWNA